MVAVPAMLVAGPDQRRPLPGRAVDHRVDRAGPNDSPLAMFCGFSSDCVKVLFHQAQMHMIAPVPAGSHPTVIGRTPLGKRPVRMRSTGATCPRRPDTRGARALTACRRHGGSASRPAGRSVSRPVGRCHGRSASWPVGRWHGRSASRPVGRCHGGSASRPVGRCHGRSVSRPVGRCHGGRCHGRSVGVTACARIRDTAAIAPSRPVRVTACAHHRLRARGKPWRAVPAGRKPWAVRGL